MRQRPELDATRVILVSAAVQPDLSHAQGTLFLSRPFEVEALLATVHTVRGG